MTKVEVKNIKNEKTEDLTLDAKVWNIEPNDIVLKKAIDLQLAATRQGTAKTKTRSEVSGGGRKPWKQKGTGRARQGSIRAPHWVGGGVTFAPKPRDYSYKVPKKVKRLAMKSALSSKVLNEEIIILDKLSLDEPKTKEMAKILSNIKAGKKALIVMDEKDMNIIKSARNIPNVQVTYVNTLNVYDILHFDSFIITKDAVRKVEEVYA